MSDRQKRAVPDRRSEQRTTASARGVLAEIPLRDAAGEQAVARVRAATAADLPAIEALIALSVRGLNRADYSEQQLEAALGSALGVDSQLVRDGTYLVAEIGDRLVACAGWSFRRTLFGADARPDREPETLDPERDAAKVRAFFVHPEEARRGLGRALLACCEAEARRAGFRSAELMATLTGVPLYRAGGYVPEATVDHVLPAGISIRFVRMRKDHLTS